MQKRILGVFLFLGLIFSCTAQSNLQSKKGSKKQPNVIIVITDDQGYGDLGAHGNPLVKTPALDKFHSESVRLTDFHVGPTCAPSRSGLMTGKYANRVGVWHTIGGVSILRKEEVTMAEVFKNNGYETAMFGKWHLGDAYPSRPQDKGFNYTVAHGGGGVGQTPDYWNKDSPNGISYPKDMVTEKALEFITKSKEEPFFLYLAHWLVHAPIHTKNKELLQYYSDKLGVDFPKEDIPIKTGGQTNPFYGSMVTTLDWSLGRVVNLLKATDDPRNPGKKLYETTYIIFSSDNGGVEKANGDIVTDNFPLDEGKKYAQEGGIRVPMLIAGPNIPKGKTEDVLINQLDFFPTILNLTNSKIPGEYSSNLDGLDISNVLLDNESVVKNNKGETREDLWWHFPHNQDHQMQSAIRHGDYKLYKNHIKGNYELYRLYKDGKRADLEEKFDIAKQNPNVVKDLSSRLEKYLTDYNAQFPYKNPSNFKNGADNENVASIPVIVSDSFDADSRKVSITLEKGKKKVIEPYALVKIANKLKKKKNGKTGKYRKHDTTFIKVPLEVSNNNLEYTFTVPKGVIEYGVILIDENRFMVQGKFHKIN